MKKILFLLLFISSITSIIVISNKLEIYPNKTEIIILNNFFNYKKINNEDDIIWIQNKVVNEIKHRDIGANKIEIEKIINLKSGQCFDRSLLLQKYFILNNIKVRPIYLFWNSNGATSKIDFLNTELKSHSIFEIYYNNNWYVICTNTLQKKLETLSYYLMHTPFIPKDVRYIRYLNNRHGRFIDPPFFPDIY